MFLTHLDVITKLAFSIQLFQALSVVEGRTTSCISTVVAKVLDTLVDFLSTFYIFLKSFA